MAVVSAGFPKGLTAYQVRLDSGQATFYPSFYSEELEPE